MAPPRPSDTAGVKKTKPKDAIAAIHDASTSIRAQAKKGKSGKDGSGAGGHDRAEMDKDIVKAVLASPLTVAWPNIPRHLQTTVMHALRQMVPDQVAEYHVSRARCHTREKRSARRAKRDGKPSAGRGRAEEQTVPAAAAVVEEEEEEVAAGSGGKRKGVPVTMDRSRSSTKKPRLGNAVDSAIPIAVAPDATAAHSPEPGTVPDRPTRPEVLGHLVLGINESIKALERQIDELKLRLMIMADALNGNLPSSQARPTIASAAPNHLLPTAPRSPSPSPSPPPEAASRAKAGTAVEADHQGPTRTSLKSAESDSAPDPLVFIVVPLLSVNPQSLVSPLPSYCATYNALIYQYTQLSKIVKNRITAPLLPEVLGKGKEREEVRVVPLGNVEKDMAEMVGLRRLACLGIRGSHPDIDMLHKLLPKSILHPPRHSITLPYPASSLKVHTGKTPGHKQPASNVTTTTTAATTEMDGIVPVPNPIPHVHYAPLHVKGIRTTVPVDNNARKAKRLEEVRRKRVEAKEKKKAMREGVKKVAVGTGKGNGNGSGKAKGKGKGKDVTKAKTRAKVVKEGTDNTGASVQDTNTS